jgi:hypothetical protein
VRTFLIANTEQVECIILGRKTAEGFIPHWASVAASPDDPDYILGKKLTDIPKTVFSNIIAKSKWSNAELAKGETIDEIYKLKKQ